MNLVRFDQVVLELGELKLFTGADFSLDAEERVCLVGRNGAGKSTLLKLITGVMEADDGIVDIKPDIRISQLDQQLADGSALTVREVVAQGMAHHQALIDHYKALSEQEPDKHLLREMEALQRDVVEIEELKLQNKELSHCLKSMEHSRKQYEADANRYRENAGAAEQQSETLRIKLEDLEKNFADIEQQQRKAIKSARKAAVVKQINGHEKPQEVDDLKEIIGIGKVFERALNDLGVFSFRQIASFGVADIARVNSKLKEFKGRMEQDDWIGQAKELHFKKYGEAS